MRSAQSLAAARIGLARLLGRKNRAQFFGRREFEGYLDWRRSDRNEKTGMTMERPIGPGVTDESARRSIDIIWWLGLQPSVSIWFTVRQLSRASKKQDREE